MKKFKHIFTNQHYIYWLFLFMVILPNFIMFFTESTSLLTRIVQIVLPLGFYAWAFTWARKPGKMFWWLFWFMFVDAFQIVLLWLYGESPIAVDMFLNVLRVACQLARCCDIRDRSLRLWYSNVDSVASC